MPTRQGVYYDLKESPFNEMFQEWEFRFSSKAKQHFFWREWRRIKARMENFQSRFLVLVNLDWFIMLETYAKVQANNIYIISPEGVVHKCLTNLVLDGLHPNYVN